MTQTILGLSIAYTLLAVVTVLLALTRPIPLIVRAGLAVAVAVLIFVTYRGIGALRGLPSDDAPQDRFRLLWGQAIEPDKLNGEPGRDFLWLNELDPDNYLVGLSRAHMLPYSQELAETVRAALARVGDGEQVAGEAPDFDTTAERLQAEAGAEGG